MPGSRWFLQGVTVQNWNGRAVRGAIVRLEQTGFVKRVRARKKGTKDKWLVCIKLLREPNADDLRNLKFRRAVPDLDQPDDEPLEEDAEGDAFMRDVDLTLLDEVDSEDGGDFEGSLGDL